MDMNGKTVKVKINKVPKITGTTVKEIHRQIQQGHGTSQTLFQVNVNIGGTNQIWEPILERGRASGSYSSTQMTEQNSNQDGQY